MTPNGSVKRVTTTRARPVRSLSSTGDPGVNVTLIGALSLSGPTTLMTIPGATTGDVFRAYVEQVSGPGDMVVMDNLHAHKVAGVAEAIANAGSESAHVRDRLMRHWLRPGNR